MEKVADIGIISLFHRGNWLASELSQQGKEVALIDLSSLFPRWTPSDWEGPFGIFRHQDLSESQLFYLFEGESIVETLNGYCIWTKNGPIEWNGPLSNLQIQKLKDSDFVMKYFRSLSQSENLQANIKESDKRDLQDVWPVYLAHHLSSLKASENHKAMQNKQALPFLDPYFFRIGSRIGLEESLENCKNFGVQVYKDSNISDVIEDNNVLNGLEITSKGRSSIQQAKTWLIMLTTSELSALDENIREALHPYAVNEPEWAWLRYEIEVEESDELKVLPYHFLLVEDIFSPWFNSNIAIFNRTMKENLFDVWLRIPNAQRFQKQYLEEVKEKLVALMQERLPTFFVKEVIMPQEYYYGFNDLGPARFVVYNEKKHNNIKRKKWKNIIWSSPENWEAQDWLNLMRTNKKTFNDLMENSTNDR